MTDNKYFCRWDQVVPDKELSQNSIVWLRVITIINATWVIFNLVYMIYIFFRFMIKLKIFGKLILQFYFLALLDQFFKLWQCYSRVFCNSYNYM